MKIISIQQKSQPNGTRPYPYFISKDGKVGRQDFWKGHPSKLLGFSKKPVSGEMEVVLQDFFFNPKQVIGMYPVFMDKNNKWFTSKDAIESIERIKK